MKVSVKLYPLLIGPMLAMPLTGQAAEIGNVTVYGKARASVDSTDNGARRVTTLSNADSRLGFKGKEDLGNGLNAIFQFETSVNLDDGAGSTSSLFGAGRNSFVGVEGGFGTFFVGIHNSAYRDATGRLDVFEESMADYNTILGDIGDLDTSVEFNRREPNMLNYWSPKFNGLQLKTQYRLDETDGASQDRYSAAALYENGPLFASLAHETHGNEGSGGTNDTQGNKLGVGYAFNDATRLGLVYEMLSEEGAGSAFDRDAWYLSLAHKIGNNTLKAAYGHANDNDAITDSGADFFALGVGHNLSKRTEVYALYATTQNDINAGYPLGSGTTGVTAPAAAGQDVSSFSVGINHSF